LILRHGQFLPVERAVQILLNQPRTVAAKPGGTYNSPIHARSGEHAKRISSGFNGFP
jgi:hypothetical protein